MRWFVVTWLLAAVALTYGLNLARNALYDPSLSDPETRGVVIDGLCPAPVDPVTVTTFSSSIYRDFYGATFDLFGTAREDGVLLSWDPPEVDDLTGYLITRAEVGRWGILGATLRVFTVDAAYGVKQYLDADGLEPYTRYKYRVFPVATTGISGMSRSLRVWTLPSRAPAAPGRLDAELYPDSLVFTSYSGFREPVTGLRVLRREVGVSEWDIVHDGPTESQRFGDHHEVTWSDNLANHGVQYEYAVCIANRLGIGKAAFVFPYRHSATVPVGPPQGISAVAEGGTITLYWEPLDERSVVGYEVERFMVDEDDKWWRRLHLKTEHRAENFVHQKRNDLPTAPHHRYRVRAMTVHGPGEWSPVAVIDIDPIAPIQADEIPTPEVVSLTASHSEVYLVWRADGSPEGVEHRILRREVGVERPYRAYQRWNWLDLDEFDWSWAWGATRTGFTDESDVRPSTEYEYAVQLRRGGELSQPSPWMAVRTRAMPLTPNRFPMQVYDLAATPTVEGIMLTWTLPDDPTLTGIEIVSTTYDYDAIGQLMPNIALPPDATSYLVDTYPSYFPRDGHVCFFVDTFNNYGIQKQAPSRACVYWDELLSCTVTPGEVDQEYYSESVTVSFRGCEEAVTQVTRSNLTPDGLEVERFIPTCSWQESTNYRFPGTLECVYEDTSVELATWYFYTLTQTFEDGYTSTTYHEILTNPRRERP